MRSLATIIFFAHMAFGQSGLSIYGGPSYGRTSDITRGVYGMSYYLASDRVPGFHEFGVVAQPFGHVRDERLSVRPKYESWVALTTGHLFILRPWLRPGFSVGPVYARTAELSDGKAKFGSDFGAYYSATLQAFLFSFTVSNLSWGAGIALTL